MQLEFINMYLLLFLNRKSGSLWAGLRGQRCCWQEGRACHLIRDESDSTAIPDELLFSPHVFTLILGRHIWSSPVSGRCSSSGDQGTWTWPCLEPPSPAPCSAAWCWWTVRFGQCGPLATVPRTFPEAPVRVSGAWEQRWMSPARTVFGVP